MKVLFIGGTGIISAAVSQQAIAKGLDLYLLNRGLRGVNPPGSRTLTADTRQPEDVKAALAGLQFDVVVNWIAYTPDDIERDLALFQGRVKQYIFISSASVYQKPPTHYLITEATPLHNPYWDYSRNKIACEERLMRAYAEVGFPVTIVRPSQTYDLNFPVAIGGGSYYTLADRLKKGRPIIVHGDGTSLWVLTHAEDFGRGFLGLVGNWKAIGNAFHITSDDVLTWEQIYQSIAEALGVEANIVHIPSDFIARIEPELAGTLLGDKTWSTVFDNSKIKRFVPDFKAVIPFRDGIRRTLAWFETDERRQRVDEAAQKRIEHILKAYVVNSAEGRVDRTPDRREALRGRDPGGSRSDP
jgi:nucleoside-diphosphate-sugar epimerase